MLGYCFAVLLVILYGQFLIGDRRLGFGCHLWRLAAWMLGGGGGPELGFMTLEYSVSLAGMRLKVVAE
jgi:hypothetical protein